MSYLCVIFSFANQTKVICKDFCQVLFSEVSSIFIRNPLILMVNVLTFKTETFCVTMASVIPTVLTGGPLKPDCEFELVEFRLHWGREDTRGSEHTVNFKAFPMEVRGIHVYWLI